MQTPRTFALALVTSLLGLAPRGAVAASCGDTLVSDTVLSASVLACVGNGLIIGADDIVLDCAGFTVSGTGTDRGIQLVGRTGVRVVNCRVSEFSRGIYLEGSSANHVVHNEVTRGTGTGGGAIELQSSTDNVVEGNRVIDNAGRGIELVASDGNLILENRLARNDFRGIDLIDSTGNAVVRNTIHDNTSAGIVVELASTANLLFDNTVTDSGSGGAAMFSGPNTLLGNAFDGNGTWGIEDTTGPTNVYVFNTCAGNGSGPSTPASLCQ